MQYKALDLINRFLGKQAFADVDLPVYSRASRPQQTLQSVLADEMYAFLIGSTSFLLGVIFCLVYIKILFLQVLAGHSSPEKTETG